MSKIYIGIRFENASDVGIQLPRELIKQRTLTDAGIADQHDETFTSDDAVAKCSEHFLIMKSVVKRRRVEDAVERRRR